MIELKHIYPIENSLINEKRDDNKIPEILIEQTFLN